MSSNTKKFVTGAAVLAVAGVLAKVLSVFFRIPLASDMMLGDEGIGYYQFPYPIYTLLIAVSYLGLPSAISKLVSERIAKNKYKEAHEIFKHTFWLLVIFGAISSAFMIIGCDWLIDVQNWPQEAKWSLLGLSLAPFFVAFMGAFRGYFQGMQNMTPTAVSQLIESFARVIVGVGLAAYVLFAVDKSNLGLAAGGASFGATAGALFGAIFLAIIYFTQRKKIKANFAKDEGSKKVGFKKSTLLVIGVALPITLGAAINSVISWIDSSVIVDRLVHALSMDEKVATGLYGILSGKAITLINVPLTISQAIVLSVMPAISEAVAKENHEEVKDKIHLGFRFAMLISLPCMAGLIALANPIMKLLYGLKTGGGDVLAILSLSLVFVMLGQLFAACLQGMGKFYLPIVNLAIACVFKFILTFYLTGVEVLNINGAAIATVITYMIYALLNLFFVKKYADYHVKDKMNSIVKPIIATLVMTVLTMGAYYGLVFIGVEQRISTLLAVCVGGITYVVMLLVTKILSKDDYESLPGGNKIYKILNKLHLA
ncbi:MAG: polysaccharide biosynthesis protein [Clostridia bacterium]|nr:polysaccharide biosynthesis protein [Clostridia bacterium]